jgi:hypothetical protein
VAGVGRLAVGLTTIGRIVTGDVRAPALISAALVEESGVVITDGLLTSGRTEIGMGLVISRISMTSLDVFPRWLEPDPEPEPEPEADPA